MEQRAANSLAGDRQLPYGKYSLISAQSSFSLAVSNLLLSGLFALMMWHSVPRSSLLVWLIVSLFFGVVELIVRQLLSRHSRAYTSGRRLLVFTLDACIGLFWLYAAIFFYPTAYTHLQFFWLFSLAAPALCTAVYQHADLPSSFARIGCALPIAAGQLYQNSDSLAIGQAFIVVALWASLIWLAVRLHRSLQYRVTLMANRDTLLQKVADNARDLDALREAEAQSRELAESANLAKSRFLAHSSHDLRQPLHAISLLLETVDDEVLDESTGHAFARVRQSVELLANLFDSLLDLTLLDTGQVEVSKSVFAIDRVFAEVITDFETVAEANAVTVNLEASDTYMNADPTIVRRMVQNLLANAIRHSAGGTVTLGSRRDGDAIYLEVADTGSGIAVGDQKKIFEEFTKLDTSVKSQSGGSLGLGLAIVNRMARLSGVEITVDSEPQHGSLFAIGPFPTSSKIAAPSSQTGISSLDLQNIRVVVVDDDHDTLKATGSLLEKWGVLVTLRTDGNVAAEPKPDILICDYELGTMETGIDVIKNTRRKLGDVIPALLISGNTSPELIALAVGEDLRLLHKPVRPAQLKSAILTMLGTATRERTITAD